MAPPPPFPPPRPSPRSPPSPWDIAPLGPARRRTQAAAYAWALVSVAGMTTFLAMHASLLTGLDGFPPRPSSFGRTLVIMLLTILVVVAVQATAAVLGIMWHYRAHENLRRLGVQGMSWQPGWAVGAWLIPYANVVLPLLVFRETWRASHALDPVSWKGAPVPPVVAWWWATWIAAQVLPTAVHMAMFFPILMSRAAGGPSSGADLSTLVLVDAVAIAATWIPAAILWDRVTLAVTEAQATLVVRARGHAA